MHVKYFVQGLTFLGAIVPSNGLNCTEACATMTLTARLGSEVYLPCHLLKSNATSEAKWSQYSSLLSVRSDGIVTFQDPRAGRVTAFPYLFHRGNFSILIHALQKSDLGVYCCELSSECQRVNINLTLTAPAGQGGGLGFPWLYIATGVGIFIILLVITCILSIRRICLKTQKDSYNVNSPHTEDTENCEEGDENPETEESRDYVDLSREEEEEEEEDYVNTRNEGHHDNSSIYENEMHDPNRNSGMWTKPHPLPKASTETLDKQPQQRAPYYVNQATFQKADGPGKKRKKQYQFKNPIYGESTVAHST